ncbi:MAG: aldehyde ferredoxin oxidoreductase family protein [Euryarchaeota archaeon]|nr:aldehyde ferredoxin oxidoreductase family protein [Euryarchaeota archaeon]
MLLNDPLSNILFVDLSKKEFWVENRRELFDNYLGGSGVGIQLLNETCPQGAKPLSPENPIIFTVGPLTGLYPLASKTVAMFKSPLTGNLGESHCGGRSAIAIRLAGYGALVIKGASDIPLYLAIHQDKVFFRDATSLWGMGSNFTVGRVIREIEPGDGFRTIMRIGRAGENLVSYACVMTETYRHFGRLGLGAVFGSKKLKGIVVSGKRSLPVGEKKEYRTSYDEIYNAAVSSTAMKKYHDIGTAENVSPLNELGGLPTKNLTEQRFPEASKISGEAFAERYLGRRLACSHCPVGCIHIAALRESYEDEKYFYKTSMISYDYEPIFALGSMLGINDPEGFLRLMDQVEILGLDAMSAGVILAWATEAQNHGLISEKETEGIRLQWGDYHAYMQMTKKIVDQSNPFFHALAQGINHAASLYGGKEYALAFGGNEMPGYHTGPGAYIGVLIGARHSHLDNAGYSVDQKNIGKPVMSPEVLVDTLIAEEEWRQILSSLVVCFFARGIYPRDIILKTLNVAGFPINSEELTLLGKTILHEKLRFKIREGYTLNVDNIPQRIFQTPSSLGLIDKEYIRTAVEYAQKKLLEAPV